MPLPVVQVQRFRREARAWLGMLAGRAWHGMAWRAARPHRTGGRARAVVLDRCGTGTDRRARRRNH